MGGVFGTGPVGDSPVHGSSTLHEAHPVGRFPQLLLATDGTVVRLLETWFDEPIRVGEHVQQVTAPGPEDAALSPVPDETILHRTVLLVGAVTDQPYLRARSATVLDRLPGPLRDDLLATDEPIGRLLARHRLETRREILSAGQGRAGQAGGPFGLEPDDDLLVRTYLIHSGGRPIMLVTEQFADTVHPGCCVGTERW